MRQSVGQRSKLHDGSGSFQRAGSWLYDRRPAALSIVTSPPARPPTTQAGHSTRYTRPHYRTVAFPPSMTNDHQSRMVVEINCLVCDHNRQLCAPSGARGPPGPSRRHQPGGRAGGRAGDERSSRIVAQPCRAAHCLAQCPTTAMNLSRARPGRTGLQYTFVGPSVDVAAPSRSCCL